MVSYSVYTFLTLTFLVTLLKFIHGNTSSTLTHCHCYIASSFKNISQYSSFFYVLNFFLFPICHSSKQNCYKHYYTTLLGQRPKSYSKPEQTFSIRGQWVNTVGFTGLTVSQPPTFATVVWKPSQTIHKWVRVVIFQCLCL